MPEMSFDPTILPYLGSLGGESGQVAPDDALFRAIFNDAGIGIALMDRHGLAIKINPALRDMLGMTVATLRNSLIDDRKRNAGGEHPLTGLWDGRCKHVRFERYFIRGNGSTVWVRVTVSAVRDMDNVPMYLVGMVEDITEQKRGDEALREAEAQYRSIFENSVEGIFQTTEDGRYLSANPALARIYGYNSPEELMAGLTNIASQLYVDPSRRDEFRRALSAHDQVVDFASQVYRKDGSKIWISENCRAVRDRRGQLMYYEGMVEDITDRKRIEDRLVHDALHDALTGLPNRTLFLDRLGHLMQRRQRREDLNYAVLFVDCDRFKLINDSLGHMVGDQLLVELSERISGCLRGCDTLARLGGDEFAILAEDLEGRDQAERVAERIRDVLSQPFLLAGQDYYLTTSIGIAFGTSDYNQPSDLLRDADTAMYEAKAGGRNRWVVFENGMHLHAVTQLQVANDLRRALERDELLVHYQPIVRIDGSGLAGFEALVRWQHPTRGLVPPDQFIPVAEETGLIDDIGEWVLEESSRQLAQWRQEDSAADGLFMSVNLSPVQLQRPQIVAELLAAVTRTGLEPSCIRLEITESAVMEHPLAMTAKLDALKGHGFRLAIDDFGTGYSSLAHLHRFPVDTLKVDRSFIAPILQGGEHLEIVRTILMLAKTLKMTVVAEGVETGEHDEILRELDCTYGQGRA